MNKELLHYLQQDTIGLVVAEALAQVYTNKPKNPVKFLASWLKKYSANQKQLQVLSRDQDIIKSNQKIYNENVEKEARESEQKDKKEREKSDILDAFKKNIVDHQYHSELLTEELPEFLQKELKLTGVYIGHVNHPEKNILEQDEEPDAHIDFSVPKVINYVGTSKSHSNLLLHKTLPLDKGVTAGALSLFLQDPQPAQDGSIQKRQKYIYIPNVVKHQNLHYFRLPKLGSYIAIPLIYDSYLTEKLYDTACASRMQYLGELAEYQKGKIEELKDIQNEKENLSEKLEDLMEKNTDTAAIQALKLEIKDIQASYKEKQQENFEEEVLELSTEKLQYVVCADTLGQDRQISEKDRLFLLETVKHFRDSWQQKERSLLYKDIDHQLSIQKKLPKKPKEVIQHLTKLTEITPQVKAQFQEITDQTLLQNKKLLWQLTQLKTQLTINTQYCDHFVQLKHFRIVKYQDLIQYILFFNQVGKQDINSRGKTILDWKNIKNRYISQGTFSDVLHYDGEGPKDRQFKHYSTLSYLQQKFQKFNQTEIFQYNIGLGSLLFIIKRFIIYRLNDIALRKEQKDKEVKIREGIIQENARLKEAKELALEKHRQALSGEQASSFNEVEWLQKFDSQNPQKEVPHEVVYHIDNDV